MSSLRERRETIPVIYTRGSHYDVGYDIGRTFAAIIQEYFEVCPTTKEFMKAYETEGGRKAYEETLAVVERQFPQYVKELKGIADGSKVPFNLLFLSHMDDVVYDPKGNEAFGCTTVCLKTEKDCVIAHNEDALTEVLNRFYLVSAHIIADEPQGRYGVKEERFTSLCYAGHLPGYTSSYNHHGLIFAINTITAKNVQSGKTPRYFITRALLGAENFEQALEILRDVGVGAANACSLNLTFLKPKIDDVKIYNIEIGPGSGAESLVDCIELDEQKGYLLHCNTFLRIPDQDNSDFLIESSNWRMQVLKKYEPPQSKKDVIAMLGDSEGDVHRVFMDIRPEDTGKTISTGVFDLVNRTWSMYIKNPTSSRPVWKVQLELKEGV